MVKVSPQLFMKLFESWQQPLTLDKRESSKLLSLLTSSFRQQLDKEHGDHSHPRALKSSSSVSKKPRRPTFSERLPPTEGHFQSILNNALFTEHTSESSKEDSFNKRKEAFEYAVSKGLMTVEKCYNYLRAEKVAILQSKVPIWDGMRDSTAGMTVLKWLKASGLAEGGQYLQDIEQNSFGLLAEFATASGLQEVLWSHVKQLCSASNLDKDKVRKVIFRMVRAELRGPKNDVNTAMSALIRAFDIMEQNPRDRASYRVLTPSVLLLSHSSTHDPQIHSKLTLDNFSSLRNMIPKVSIKAAWLHAAHLDIHHPETPSHREALRLFEYIHTSDTAGFYTSSPALCEKAIYLGLETSKYLLEQGQLEEAKKVMDVLQDKYSEQLGTSKAPETPHTESEAHNIELLDGLSLI